MKIKFNHEIYGQIIMDTDELKPVNTLLENEYHREHWDEMYLGDTINFGHSTCMWFDGFLEYNHIQFIDLSESAIRHEFDKLKYKYGETYEEIRNQHIVQTDLDFNNWYKENIAYKNKRPS